MISRRDFLRLAGFAGASLVIPWKVGPGRLRAAQAHGGAPKRVFSGSRPGTDFIKYVDPLPIIEVMPHAGVAHHYQIEMRQFAQKINRDLPPTPLWGFGPPGFSPSWPGRTIEARVNLPVKVRWINRLPSTHLLAGTLDYTIHGAEREFPDVRTVVHLHGGATRADSDGIAQNSYSLKIIIG